MSWPQASQVSILSFSQVTISPLPSPVLPGTLFMGASVNLRGKKMGREAIIQERRKRSGRGDRARLGWGRLSRWQPFTPASSRILQTAGLALLSQPCLPPPRKPAACARVNTIQVINCLQQLAPAPGPAEALALEEGANYSFINIHTAT